MADVVANESLGRLVQRNADDANKIGVLLLESAEADDALRDHDELAALLGAAGNTEAAFTNYARKELLTATLDEDDTNNVRDLDIPDQTWTSAGNGTNETLAKLVVFHAGANAGDTDRIPATLQDFTPTTDGSDLTAQFNAEGFYRAS